MSQLWAQNRALTGKVVDDKGNPIANASILVKGTTLGTTADAAGNFKLNVPATAKVLIISSLNFEAQEIVIGSKTSFSVSLKSTSGLLDDVVVTGIKTVKRTEYAGAVSRVTRDVTENKPVGSLDQLLQGAAPGLLVITGSGQPGTSANVTIRGTNSVSSGSSPLYVIDGIPVETGVFQGINPNDIESLDILKDASASALYGSRGSAGVIVITTKRGKAGKMKLSYATQMGTKSKPEFAFRPMNTSELFKAQEDYGKIAGGTSAMPGWYYSKSNPRYSTLTAAQQAAEALAYDSISKINTNWADYFFKTGTFSRHQLTVSGGTGKTRVYSNLEFYSEDGTTARTDMKRGSWRTNVDYADDHLTIGFNSSLGFTRRNFQQSTATNGLANPFLAVNLATPYSKAFRDATYTPVDASGNPVSKYLGNYTVGIGSNFVGGNALDLTAYDANYNDQIKAVFGLNASYKITKEISASLITGFDFRETQGSNYGSKLAFSRLISSSLTGTAGFQAESLTRFFQVDVRPSLNFTKLFASKHKVDITAYGEYLRQFIKTFNFTGFDIDPRTPNTPAAITPGNAANSLFITATGNKTQNSLLSGLVVGSYTYDDKYSFTGSYRTDGSSRLPKQNTWAQFYSVGGVWTLSKENFLKNVSWINSLRLRASYGGAGNNGDNFPFSDFSYLATYGQGGYSGLNTLAVNSIGNPDLKWETTYTANIGTDFAFWKNRIRGSIDIYDKRTKDIYLNKKLSAEGGGYIVPTSAGTLQNKGIEVDLSYDLMKTNNFVWTLKANVALNRNKLLSLGGVAPYTVGTSYLTEGLPLGSLFEVKWGGVDAATGQPLYYTKDGVLTTSYSANDKVQTYGTYEAPWKGGFGTNVSYKNFNLSATFTWQKEAYKTDNLEYFVENPVGFMSVGYNQSSSLNFWKKPGDVTSTPSPLYGTNFSSKIIHDASFLRFRDLTISYSVPKAAIEKLKFISKVNFYVQGTNLFIWTKWRGMDPEAGPVNINLSEYPNPRGITGGLDITF